MIHIALYQPEIPQNTGNIIRLCANLGADLHLVLPLGFVWDDRRLKRSGLDYHEYAEVRRHRDWAALQEHLGQRRIFAYTTRASRIHSQASFSPSDVLLFGPETRGLPENVLGQIPPDQHLRLPMKPDSRSLNLSNAVAAAAYEAFRQLNYPDLV
ncbi:MAG: tRNA (cytidine(34)-2'-O)-methyltransferase [Xanthomonadales bacterium]|nr:tRNA (cytidine(34)-2'-O)-methyltransferase [Xanthomonadales bacterium]